MAICGRRHITVDLRIKHGLGGFGAQDNILYDFEVCRMPSPAALNITVRRQIVDGDR